MKKLLRLSAFFMLLPALFLASCNDDDDKKGDEYPLLPAKSLIATAGDAQVDLSWTAPTSEFLKEYAVSWTPGNGKATVAKGTVVYKATGLTNGTAYTFTVKAVYERGASEAVTIAATPEAALITYPVCTDVVAAPGYKSIALSWTKPAAFDVATLAGYTVTVTPGDKTVECAADATSVDLDELANGTEYTISIVAKYSDKGISAAVTAKATPVDPVVAVTSADAYVKRMADPTGDNFNLYYLKDVNKTAIPVVFELVTGATIEGATNSTVTLDLSEAAGKRVDVNFGGNVVSYPITAEVDTLIHTAAATFESLTAATQVNNTAKTVSIDFGTQQINKKTIDVVLTISANAKMVSPATTTATMDLSVATPKISLTDKYGRTVIYNVTCKGEAIEPPVELMNPTDYTGKEIPAAWERVTEYNGKAIPATMALYKVQDDAFVVIWAAGSNFKALTNGAARPFAEYATDYAADNAVLVSGTPNTQTVIHESSLVVKAGEGPLFAYTQQGFWQHNTGRIENDVFVNVDAGATPWNVVEGFTGNGFYLNPGDVGNGGITPGPTPNDKKSQCFFAYHRTADATVGVSKGDIAGFFISGGNAYTHNETCQALIDIGLNAGFPMHAVDQAAGTMSIGLTINGQTVIDTEVGAVFCAVGIN